MKKLTPHQIQQARNCPKEYGAATDLAKRLGISVQHVCAIRLGRTCSGKSPGRPRTNDDKVLIRCMIDKDAFETLQRISLNIPKAITIASEFYSSHH